MVHCDLILHIFIIKLKFFFHYYTGSIQDQSVNSVFIKTLKVKQYVWGSDSVLGTGEGYAFSTSLQRDRGCVVPPPPLSRFRLNTQVKSLPKWEKSSFSWRMKTMIACLRTIFRVTCRPSPIADIRRQRSGKRTFDGGRERNFMCSYFF